MNFIDQADSNWALTVTSEFTTKRATSFIIMESEVKFRAQIPKA